MRIRGIFATALLLASMGVAPSRAVATVVRQPVAFTVTNPAVPGSSYTVRGVMVRPAAGCHTSVLLAMHGLSYGAWAWDFPLRPHDYSVAESLARRGFATVAVDELGYGTSAGAGMPDHPNGYTLSVEAYADMTVQIARALKDGSYTADDHPAFAHLGFLGHSAGSEIIELAAAEAPGLAEVLIPTAYTHVPFMNTDWLVREWFSDNQRAAQSDYEYFETDPATRAKDFYTLENADADVVAWDTDHAALTPSGEIYSIGSQPSRFLLPTITVPVLLVLADADALFPASHGENELRLFANAADKTLLVAPNSGHVFMLQRNAAQTNARIADWLGTRFPLC